LCEDDYCQICELYASCEQCIQGADETDTGCQCDEGYTYYDSSDICEPCPEFCFECSQADRCDICDDKYFVNDEGKCDPCHESCQVCQSEFNENCDECIDSYVKLLPDNSCVPECPTGTTLTADGNCESPDDLSALTYCFTANGKLEELTQGDVLIGKTDESMKIEPIYKRGLYFNGALSLTISGMILSTEFTMSIWLRAETGNGVIIDLNDESIHANVVLANWDVIWRDEDTPGDPDIFGFKLEEAEWT